jgi:arylsulfatase A-like enzyme
MRSVNRLHRLFVAELVCAALWLPANILAAERPNIVVILADDLGYADLQCCGATDMRTPHLNQLYAAGMQFSNAYANCPVCSPTRAALLSGRYQAFVGVPGVIRTHPENSWGYLDPNALLLPKIAQRAGYTTACIGKWHLGMESPNIPTDRGFDHFHGFLGDMMDDYYHHRRHDINYMRLGTELIDPDGHATDLFTQWTVDFLDEHDQSQPFLLYLAYNAPHTPIQPPEDWLAKVFSREPGMDVKRARLVALIEHMDHCIGQVVAALRERDLFENTIIVFTSDNGGQISVGANNGDLRDGKQSVYEGGLKVPMAVVWPDHVAAGAQSDVRCLSMDILSTVFDACEIPISHEIEGRSFLPALMKKQQPPLRESWFFTRREGGLRYGGKTIEAVRRGPWKLLQNSPFAPLELYNLETDPREEVNVAAEHRQVVNQLNALLRSHIQDGGRIPWQPPQ